MYYRTFNKRDELPEGEEIMVVEPDEGDNDAIFIGRYINGDFVEEPNNMIAGDPIDNITAYLDDTKPLYVQESAEDLYNIAIECAETMEECNGDLLTFAEMREQQICEPLGEDDEEYDEEN